MTRKKFGFWVIPENSCYQKFDKIIKNYSSILGTPCFVPHVTLYGTVESTEEEVVKIVASVAKKTTPFEVQVGITEFSTTYFQCVFSRIRTSARLLSLHVAIGRVFGVEQIGLYMPHASIVYGDLTLEDREKISREIDLSGEKFEVEKITIVRADTDDPKDWEVFDKVSLSM